MLPQPEILEDIEIMLLLEGVWQIYGVDFRNYAYASLRRRILSFIRYEKLHTVSELQNLVLHDPAYMKKFANLITVHTTSMFRDPEFYLALRNDIIPLLKTYPLIRIWLAGCSTGQEAYSIAIMLKEEKIYDRCRIYATDANETALRKAMTGIIPLSCMKEYTDNYLRAGGKQAFSEYYTANYDNVILHNSLSKNIVFAQHNLVTDGSFNEFNLVLVRNVIIYFDEILSQRVLDLVHNSMAMFGILGLGKKESLRSTGLEKYYEELDISQKLYRRYA